jgi:signal transduction histidine kinase
MSQANRLNLFCDISRAINQSPDLKTLLSKVNDLLFNWVEADRACILVFDQLSDDFESTAYASREGLPPGEFAICSKIVAQAQQSLGIGCVKHSSLQRDKVSKAISVPLHARNNVLGLIYLDFLDETKNRGSIPDLEQTKVLNSIAAQLAVAIQSHLDQQARLQSEPSTSTGDKLVSLSHHIKNILQGATGGAHILQESLSTGNLELAKQGWEIVQRNQTKVSQILLDLISSSCTDEPEFALTNLNSLVSKVIQKLQLTHKLSQLRTLWEPNKEIPKILVQQHSIFQSIENLILNAAEACQANPNGCVNISLEFDSPKSEYKIIVRDNGCGISEEDLPNIFSPFETSKTDRKTGIGLAAAQKFARDHNGEVLVSSKLGEGSEFTLVLPENCQTDLQRSFSNPNA